MAIKLAINGFGRIGRTAFKVASFFEQVQVVAINDLTDTKTLAYLLTHDTAYGRWQKQVSFDEKNLIVDGKPVPVFAEKDPSKLPWAAFAVDVVIESTGRFTSLEGASAHLTAGAKKVVISAPAKDGKVPTKIIGINDSSFEGATVINNASCTTNCIAPIMKVLEESFGIEKALMSTVHAYTADQNLQDGPHKDLRRARAAAANIVPTTTGAAIATTEALPSLKEKFDGLAIRVPVIVGSLSDITVLLSRNVTVEEVNLSLKNAANSSLKGILAVSEEPLVSSDIVGSPASAIVDLSLTKVIGGNLVKVVAWYDNEWGYSCRLLEMAIKFASTS
jgi:glyceraldehyde 3-phosphate dehydrogenase